MSTQWIVVADRSRARVFETEGNFDSLREVEDLLNPEGRLDDAELRHDAKGHYFGKGEQQQVHTADPHVSRLQHDEENFSREVMDLLTRGCDAHSYESLVMVAPPEFLGLLRKQLPERVEQHVIGQIDKDISSLALREIAAYLKQHLH